MLVLGVVAGALTAALTNLTGKEAEASCETVVRESYSTRRRRTTRITYYAFDADGRAASGSDSLMIASAADLCREGRMTVVYCPFLPWSNYPRGMETKVWLMPVALAMLAAVVSTLG